MQQERKFAQISSLNKILYEYEARMKFAQICSQNGNLQKYAAKMEI